MSWNCFVWNLISHIPSITGLEVSHAINVRPISMTFTRNVLNDLMYTHTKNHINPNRLSYTFWCWPQTAITFGEECIWYVIISCYANAFMQAWHTVGIFPSIKHPAPHKHRPTCNSPLYSPLVWILVLTWENNIWIYFSNVYHYLN